MTLLNSLGIDNVRSRLSLAVLAVALGTAASAETVRLADDWQIRSAREAKADGAAISRADFKADRWVMTSVPNTVVGALVTAKVFPDPYYGRNLRDLPGVTYPEATNFSHTPMDPKSPFASTWWYRRAFDRPGSFRNKKVSLRFDGINYRANVWVNGTRIAAEDQIVGTFRIYEFDVTKLLQEEDNVVAVEVRAPDVTDMALTWVDWNPMPPDRNMGLYQPVYLVSSGPVALRAPHVVTKVAPSLDKARLTVTVEAKNTEAREAETVVKGRIDGIAFQKKILLAPGETRLVEFDPDDFPQLALDKPRLWWPHQLGPQNLYDLALEARVDGAVSDEAAVRFGVREFTSELGETGSRLFRVNGKPLLIRGGGWASDMMLRQDRNRIEIELRYVKEMNLNTVRLEGKPEADFFYEIADREGILVMPGWCCCDQWEEWKKWTVENRWVSVESTRDQIRRLRNYASVFTWLIASDRLPPVDAERAYRDAIEDARFQNPVLLSAYNVTSTVSGPSGVKMNGPYDWVPPSYWLTDKTRGGAFGFNTETSPGVAIPPVESLKEFIPEDQLWPINKYWLFHAGGAEFRNIERFGKAMEARFGKPTGLQDYVWKAEAMAYEGERAMFEAFGRNKYTSTGIIQWMLNNAWPSLIWHLYDYTLRPAGGFFGTKKACEPVHIQYSYDDRSIVVVNESGKARQGLRATAQILDLQWKELFSASETTDAPTDKALRVMTLPETGLPLTYFVRLKLEDADGRLVSRNFYWLSSRADVLSAEKDLPWFYTPTKVHGDFTALASLPRVSVKLEVARETDVPDAVESALVVKATNESDAPAFLVRLRLTDGAGGTDVRPVFWDDNYFELAPRESRDIRVSFRRRDVTKEPTVVVDGWNVR
jgi:exo-1,4-beta-D-glucosaminidase